MENNKEQFFKFRDKTQLVVNVKHILVVGKSDDGLIIKFNLYENDMLVTVGLEYTCKKRRDEDYRRFVKEVYLKDL